jgi:diguanylate cyclase
LGEGKPSLVVSMPVMGAQGQAIGVVAINLDVQGMFDQLAQDLPPEFQVYLANGAGDILIHPNASLTFGFDRGQRHLLQDLMPPTGALVGKALDEVVFDLPVGPHVREPLVAAFIRHDIQVTSDENQLLLGLAQPLRQVLAEVERLRLSIVNIVAVLSLVWLALAVVLARALSRPINDIGRAARQFAQGKVAADLPTSRNDEIGDLARSFSSMQGQITQQLEALEVSRQELSDQARHDGLTGLANRRLFGERLNAALAHRRRHGGEVALLFVDLDRFKHINDTQGHEAGDEVLKAVAQRLSDHTREVDTAARLGGDEFVVLLSGELEAAALSHFAHKLLDLLAQPIPYGDQALQVGCSIGISRTPVDGDFADGLLMAADEAMYEAKEAGRHSVRFATPAVAEASELA